MLKLTVTANKDEEIRALIDLFKLNGIAVRVKPPDKSKITEGGKALRWLNLDLYKYGVFGQSEG